MRRRAAAVIFDACACGRLPSSAAVRCCSVPANAHQIGEPRGQSFNFLRRLFAHCLPPLPAKPIKPLEFAASPFGSPSLRFRSRLPQNVPSFHFIKTHSTAPRCPPCALGIDDRHVNHASPPPAARRRQVHPRSRLTLSSSAHFRTASERAPLVFRLHQYILLASTRQIA